MCVCRLKDELLLYYINIRDANTRKHVTSVMVFSFRVYVCRLKDEPMVCELLRQLLDYLEERATTEETCRAYMKYIEHTYYKVKYSD